MNGRTIGWSVAALVVLGLAYLSLGGAIDYPDKDLREIDRDQLFARTERLLAESESWPAELQDGNVVLSTSLEPAPIRTIRYSIEVEGSMEKAIELLRFENYSGEGRREREGLDKWEETLWEGPPQADGFPSTWVRRSVHIAPPPGGNRDAVVLYFEDRPDDKTYRLAFESIETIDGKPVPEVEGAVRFKVLPSIYKVDEIAPGRILIRKYECVDPRGVMSPWLNNHLISKLFFRRFMFEQAKELRDTIAAAGAS